VKAKLQQGEAALIVCCHFIDPSVYELVSLLGFDGIWLDLEHHATSDETAAALMRAARVGASDVIARPAKGEFMRMGRLLEAGAQGIMYPRCESPQEAAELVRWAKFAPQGNGAWTAPTETILIAPCRCRRISARPMTTRCWSPSSSRPARWTRPTRLPPLPAWTC
jgi:4-hydroxy-2-oxoheptanedioate aldolase